MHATILGPETEVLVSAWICITRLGQDTLDAVRKGRGRRAEGGGQLSTGYAFGPCEYVSPNE